MKNRILFYLEPGEGALPLRLGESRDEIAQMMSQAGYPRNYRRDDSDYFVSSAVQVEYNAHGRASFIGIAPHARIELLYHGVDLLRTPAKQVFDLVHKNETQQDDAEYSPLEYLFPDQIITLWAADKQYELNGERTPANGMDRLLLRASRLVFRDFHLHRKGAASHGQEITAEHFGPVVHRH